MNAANWEIIKWWELRRMPYTIAVAAVGVISFFAANSIVDNYAITGEEYLKPISLLIGVPFLVILANVCYTLGWVTELLRRGKLETRRFRIVAFYNRFTAIHGSNVGSSLDCPSVVDAAPVSLALVPVPERA